MSLLANAAPAMAGAIAAIAGYGYVRWLHRKPVERTAAPPIAQPVNQDPLPPILRMGTEELVVKDLWQSLQARHAEMMQAGKATPTTSVRVSLKPGLRMPRKQSLDG